MATRIPDAGSTNYPLLASLVHSCIQEDKLSKLRAILWKHKKEQRPLIVNQKINGNTPLFTACQKGKVQFVNFLLDDCEANIEMKGVYEVAEDHSKHEVSPLWCASVANKLDVVKTLIQHGANVNMPSDTDSTPVRSACYMTNKDVIKYLVQHGADIHKPNVNGGTCLINSVQSAELCKFLIDKGAEVNAVDNSKNTALQYAVREGVISSVKLLLDSGADYRIQNDFGDDSLQTAAMRGNKDIVDLIIEVLKLGREETIKAYELLGTNFVDEKDDMVSALLVWRKAMALRYSDPGRPILKVLPTERKQAYRYVKEPETCQELENLFDPEDIHMQALLIRERILTPHHRDTTFGLMYRGAVYADSHQFQRCVDLWKYAYTLRCQSPEPMNHECIFTIQALVKLFWEIQVEVESSATDEIIKVMDALEVLEVFTEHIFTAKANLGSLKPKAVVLNDQNLTDQDEFKMLLQLYLHLVHLITRLDCTQEQKQQFFRTVHSLVSKKPSWEGITLLHLAVNSSITLTGGEYYSQFPSMEVVKVLIACGADINAKSDTGNTPLFDAITLNFGNDDNHSVVTYLLNAGAHVDAVNNEGKTPLSEIFVQGVSVCALQYISLKCLAATVIMEHNIEFRNEIPTTLVPFVELHGKMKTSGSQSDSIN